MSPARALTAALAVAAGAARLSGAPPEAAVVSSVADAVWKRRLDKEVSLRLTHGFPVTRLPEVSLAEEEAEAAFAREQLARLQGVRPGDVSPEDWLTVEILRFSLENTVEGVRHYWLSFPVTPYSSPIASANRAFTEFRFREVGDLEAYLALLRRYPAFVGQLRAKLEGQEQRGIRLPKEEVDLVASFLAGYARTGEASVLHVKAERLQGVDETRARAFRAAVDEVIAKEIAPALESLGRWLTGPYRERAPDAVGLWQYPGGPEAYRYLVRLHTTMEVTPEQVHEIGLAEVARIEAQMQEIRRRIGFEGSRAAFAEAVRKDPRLVPRTADDIGERLRAHARAIEPRMEAFFRSRPRAPYDVARLPPALEGALTYGYYQTPTAAEPRGIYFYNGASPSERSLINAAALAYHELVPGHHLQIAGQMENQRLHPVRRERFDTAYVEGWGTYAADLAEEMGMYKDPYDLYGRLVMEMFLATRLVVDTGMNHFRWPRSKAAAFMKERLEQSDTQIHTETLRYSVDMPGQALAYRMGARRLRELREEVRRARGDRFDIRDFHDAVLGSGSMPMAVLEKHLRTLVAPDPSRPPVP